VVTCAPFDGPIVLADGVSDGRVLHAAEVLGADLAYMGTRFIATRESMAPERCKQMLVESSLDDVLLTRAFTGLQTNMLRPSIVAAALDPDALPERGAIDLAADISIEARECHGQSETPHFGQLKCPHPLTTEVESAGKNRS